MINCIISWGVAVTCSEVMDARLARPCVHFMADIQTWSKSGSARSWLHIRITWGVLKTLLSTGCTPDQLNLNLWKWEPDICSFKRSPSKSSAAKVENLWELRSHYMFRGKRCATKQNKRAATVRSSCVILSSLIKDLLRFVSWDPLLSLGEAEPQGSQNWQASQGLNALHQAHDFPPLLAPVYQWRDL